MYIDGDAPTGAVKDELWNVYDKIDPLPAEILF